jgi:hypothetical protein
MPGPGPTTPEKAVNNVSKGRKIKTLPISIEPMTLFLVAEVAPVVSWPSFNFPGSEVIKKSK